MTNVKVEKVVDAGPSEVAKAAAEWFMVEMDYPNLSKPARAAFDLGVALASSPAYREFVATDGYRELKARLNPGYVLSSGPAPKETKARAKSNHQPVAGSDPTAAEIRDWAAAAGYEVPARGRLPQIVKDAYVAEAKKAAKPKAAAKAPKAAVKLTSAERRKQILAATGAKKSGRASRNTTAAGETDY